MLNQQTKIISRYKITCCHVVVVERFTVERPEVEYGVMKMVGRGHVEIMEYLSPSLLNNRERGSRDMIHETVLA